MADGMERFVPDLEKVLIKDCGHWTQQEQPEETNRVMIDWLKRRFRLSAFQSRRESGPAGNSPHDPCARIRQTPSTPFPMPRRTIRG